MPVVGGGSGRRAMVAELCRRVDATPWTRKKRPVTGIAGGKMASGLECEFATIHEIVKAAKIRLSPNIWDYLIGGTETETTLRRNRLALDSIAFKPRVLRDVSKIDPSSEIFGRGIRLPVMLAPVGSLESFEPGGGITVAKGAGAGNVPMLISSVTTLRLEDIVKGGDA